MPEESIEQFHSYMSGQYGNFPDLETFKTTMQDTTKRRKFYDGISKDYKNFPDYESFSKAMTIEPGLLARLWNYVKPEHDPTKAAIRKQLTESFANPEDFGSDKLEEISNAMEPIIKPMGEFSRGFIKGATAGVIGDILAHPDPAYLEDRNFVDKISEASGEFTGFLLGVPLKLGKTATEVALKTGGGKKLLEWSAKRIGEKAPAWLTEAVALGTASAIGDSQRTFKVLQDPSFSNITDDILGRATSFGFGAATGARFGIIRDKIGRFAYRAALNLAISNGTHIALNRGELPDTETLVFNSLLDVWFSKNGKMPSKIEQDILREHAKEVTDKVISKGGVDYTERARVIADKLDKGEVLTRGEFEEVRRTEKVRAGVDVKTDMEGLKQQLRDKGFSTEAERVEKAESIIADLEKIPEEIRQQESAKIQEKARQLGEELSKKDINKDKAEAIIADLEKIKTEIGDQIEIGLPGAKVTKRVKFEVSEKEIESEARKIENERKQSKLKALTPGDLRQRAIDRLEAKAALPVGATFEAGTRKATIAPLEREAPTVENITQRIGEGTPKPEEVRVSDAKELKDNPQAEGVPEKQIKENIRKVQSKTSKSKQKPVLAVKTKDGIVLKDANAKNHADLVERQNVNPDNIENTGWLIDGKYQSYFDMGKKRAESKKEKPSEQPLEKRKETSKRISRRKKEAAKAEEPKLGTKEARIKALRNLNSTEAAESFGKVTELKEKDFHREYARLQKEREDLHKQHSEAKKATDKEKIMGKLADNTFKKQLVREALQSKTGKHYRELEGELRERKPKQQKPKEEKVLEGKTEVKFKGLQKIPGEDVSIPMVDLPNESTVGYDSARHFLSKAEQAKLDKATKESKERVVEEPEAIRIMENPIQKKVEASDADQKIIKSVESKTEAKPASEIIKPKEYKVGDKIDHPQYGKLEVVDNTNPDYLVVKPEKGKEFNVSRDILEAQKMIYKSGFDIPKKWIERFVHGDPAKEQSRALIRQLLGEKGHRDFVMSNYLDAQVVDWYKSFKPDERIKFLIMAEKNKSIAEFEKEFPGRGKVLHDFAAKEYREILDEAYNLSVNTGQEVSFIENYWPHIWERPEKARSYLAGKLQRSPSFAKKRFIDSIEDGIKAGLKLKTDNPAELVLMRYLMGSQHRMTLDFMSDMKDAGLIKFLRTGQPLPDGWGKIKGNNLKVFFPKTGPRGGVSLTLGGDWIMPEGAVRLVDNFLSPSIWSNQKWYGKLFRGASYTKNAYVSTLLSLSGFHAVETSVSSVATQMTIGAKEILRGDISSGLIDIAKAPVEPITALGTTGVIKAYETGKFTSDYQRQMVEIMQRANFRPRMSKEWDLGADKIYRKVYIDWLKGNKIGALGGVVPATMQLLSMPIMRYYVPRLKTNAYLKLAGDYLRTNPGVSESQQNIALSKIADVVDNRFGQMIYDNLFWNRYVRDTGVFMSLSMGWNLGTWRELGGAVTDAGRIVVGKAGGEKIDLVDFLAGKDLGQLNATPDRLLYTAFYTATFATIGAILTYAMTGKGPDQVLDYFYPPTGNKNPDGSDERFQMPTMIKEVFNSKEALRKYGLIGGTADYATHKLSPLISTSIDLIQNKNYWGAEIKDPSAPAVKQAEQIAEFLYSQSAPISIRAYLRHKDIAGEASVLPLLGFNVAKPTIARSDIQNEIYDLWTQSFPKVFTKIQSEKIQERKEVKKLIFDGKYVDAKIKFLELKKKGIITNRSWQSYLKEYSLPSDVRAFKGLSEEQQDYLYGKMDKQEKLKYGSFLKSKKGSTSRTRRRGSRTRSRAR